MSIRAQVSLHIKAGRLFSVEPLLDSDPVMRTLVVSEEVRSLLDGPWADASVERRAGRLRANLETFIKGDAIAISLEPYHHTNAYMGRLDRPEDEVWDIRSVDPSPAVRVFGRFAERDLFVGFRWAPRSKEWNSRRPMGARDSLEYDFMILDCQQLWDEFFPGYSPLSGRRPNDYASNSFSV